MTDTRSPTFEQQVAEALLDLSIPRKTHSVGVVRNILAPRVVAAIEAAIGPPEGRRVHAYELREAALAALRGTQL